MVFSSIPFIFFFFPLFLILYFLVPFKFKNYILLIFSLIFYAWGEPIYILLMILSCLINYLYALIAHKYKHKRLIFILCIVLNILILGFFKYANFLIDIMNGVLKVGIDNLDISLPIGISFFTFQTLSYSIDVYKNKFKAEKNFFTFTTYVSMFPQLIAGPIVRYETVASELKKREINFTNFSNGLERFLIGLFKKVLIANKVGMLWTSISGLESMSVLTAWLGILAYSLQIYYDFSGYSDMAIGMGKMLGFNYLENFDYPYISKSITEFWRRWHISLSSWFRDYVYIPLGGNRKGIKRQVLNILIVWGLTGLWHGANYNFILWGVYYGTILLIEKFVLNNILKKLPDYLKHIYAIFFILIGWLIFASESITMFNSYFINLFNFIKFPIFDNYFLFQLYNNIIIILIAIIFSTPIYSKINSKLKEQKYGIVVNVVYICLFIYTVACLVSDSYNPFLYFRF